MAVSADQARELGLARERISLVGEGTYWINFGHTVCAQSTGPTW